MAKRRPRKFIQETGIGEHKGALHRQLRIPEGEHIPVPVLRRAAHAPGKLGKRARMALMLRRLPHHVGPLGTHRVKRKRRAHHHAGGR
jgi:hypothetical protein